MSESVESQELLSPDYSHLDKKKDEKKEKMFGILILTLLVLNCLYGIIIGIKIKKMSIDIQDKDKKDKIEKTGILFIVSSVLILISMILFGLAAKYDSRQLSMASFGIFLPAIIINFYTTTFDSLGEKETRIYGGFGIGFYASIIISIGFFFRNLYKNSLEK